MLKALVWKQFYELFRSYYVNQKTGKRRKPLNIVGLYILFAFLMVILMASFFGMGSALAESFAEAGILWLFFAIMGILSVLLGTFGSVFNTYASLYVAKDNEQMLALPIPPSTLLASRLISVYLLSLLYSALVWLPTVLWGILVSPSALTILSSSLLTLVIPVFVSATTCILGWLVAVLSTKLKNKSIFVALLSVVFFVIYYAFCFRMNDIMTFMVNRGAEVAGTVKVWGFLFYMLGQAADGQLLFFLGFTLLSFALFALVFHVMAKSFVKITAMSAATAKKKEYKEQTVKASSIKQALLKKEFKRFTSSATYMMNGAFGALIMMALPIIMLIKRATFKEFLSAQPSFAKYVPIGLAAAYCMTTGMDMIAAPSISLEGKSIWVLRTLPVSGKDILEAKARVQQMVNLYPAAVSIFVVSLLLDVRPDFIVCIMFWVFLYINTTSYVGIIVGINNPSFNWVNETTVIKSSINVLIVMILDAVLALGPAALVLIAEKVVSVQAYMIIVCAGFFILEVLLKKWVDTKGSAKFDLL